MSDKAKVSELDRRAAWVIARDLKKADTAKRAWVEIFGRTAICRALRALRDTGAVITYRPTPAVYSINPGYKLPGS